MDAPASDRIDLNRMTREVERLLNEPRFDGIAMGATLNDRLEMDFVEGHGEWTRTTRWLDRARMVRHRLRPRLDPDETPSLPRGAILVTWERSTPRIDDLLLPVISELAPDGVAILYHDQSVVPRAPQGVPAMGWRHVLKFDAAAWRSEYERCRPEWHARLADACRTFSLAPGAFEALALDLMLATQRVAGSLAFLRHRRPAAVVTEYDRHYLWSCLVLAAVRLEIPTVTLVHGVMRQDAATFSPVLADRVLCWGRLDRDKLRAAGEPEQKLEVVGCPRLTRGLPTDTPTAKGLLGLAPDRPAVMFATTPESGRLELAAAFCASMTRLDGVQAVVRLHPAEMVDAYADVVRRFPQVRFMPNSEAGLDHALSAADVVVVRGSGMGSDALVKRRPVVVLSPESDGAAHDVDLVERAGCPRARSVADLADIVGRMLRDEAYRERHDEAAEQYVADFCATFGSEAARRSARAIREVARPPVQSRVGPVTGEVEP